MPRIISRCVIPVIVILILSVVSHANPITVTTPIGALTPDGPVSAEAVFTFGMGTLEIDLTNLQTGIISVGQTISGLSFQTDNPVDPGVTSIITSWGHTVNIDAVTKIATTINPKQEPLPRWHLTIPTTTLLAIGGGQPDHLIMNPDLSQINAGSFGGQFDPFILGTAHFEISAANFTENTTISSVTFAFGTGPDAYISTVPEPATLSLLGIGLIGAGLVAYRKRQK
ncbi:MAG: PEP-CTERM sorting domain-containing protein [Acidobacteria bacterium]|nr:PEP-CTERM sorting domain-containing protein [Acidobacteriota bacterium]